MGNLNREPKLATTIRPKMQHFKMGIQVKHRHAKRLGAMTNQSFMDDSGKVFYNLTIDRIYSNDDGTYTGSIKHFGKVIHVVKNSRGVWDSQ